MPSLEELIQTQTARLDAAGVCLGHGTTNTYDEAAWLTLWAMGLPIVSLQDLGDRLHAAVSPSEQAAVEALIDERIASRKPAAYLTCEAWLQGVPFYVDERVIVPRSFIAELLTDGTTDTWLQPAQPRRILDLCTGNGSLAVLAAMTYPEAHVIASDISEEALAVARINRQKHGLEERITLVASDGLSGIAGTFDLILCNPPYVDAKSMAALPLEYQAEPAMALDGGIDGMDFIRQLLSEVSRLLNPHGILVLEIGNAQAAFEASFPHQPVVWLPCSAGEYQVLLIDRKMLSLE